MGYTAISHVQIVRLRRILGSQRIYLLHNRYDTCGQAATAHYQRSLFDVHFLFHTQGTGNLEIRKALHLRPAQQVIVHHIDAFTGMQSLGRILDVLQFLQEPLVYLRQFMNPVYRITLLHGLGDDKDTLVGRLVQGGIDVVDLQFLVLHKTMHPLTYHAQAFLDGLFESTAYGHHLAYRLHGGTQLAVHTSELTQIPARYLAHHIIQRRLEEGRRCFRHGVFQFKQPVTQPQLGRHKSQRIPRGLGGQSRRTAQTGIHLYDTVILRLRVESILHITFSHDSDVTDDADAQRPQFVVFRIGQRLRGSNHDTFTGMNAERVKVFHVAHRDTVVIPVAHHFVFNLFPSFQALLYQHLR